MVKTYTLWYNKIVVETKPTTPSAPLCNRCGSKLIRVTKKTKKIEGQKFPVTTITYKCSDPACQRQINKETRERKQKEKERAMKKQPRTA